ncbi:MAG: hypothetical protein HYV60_04540 [Planctomycetia bacterium]|nr:hypothetical protein [Planctomycetia bacterium]
MTRIQKTVLWSVAVCVFCILGARILIVAGPAVALAQAPESAKGGVDQGGGAALPAPEEVAEPPVDGPVVTYPFQTPGVLNVARRLQEQYAGRANIGLDSRSESLIVRAPVDVQAEIRAVVGFLTKQQPEPTSVSPPSPAKVAEPAVNGSTVAYPFKTPDPQNDAQRLQAQYFDRANITIAVSSPRPTCRPRFGRSSVSLRGNNLSRRTQAAVPATCQWPPRGRRHSTATLDWPNSNSKPRSSGFAPPDSS